LSQQGFAQAPAGYYNNAKVVTPWKLNYTISLRIILYKIMQDCTWLTKLHIDKFYEKTVLFRYVFWKPSWCWSLQLQYYSYTTMRQLCKWSCYNRDTLYHNLYLVQLHQWFQMLISLLQLTESENGGSNYPHSVVATPYFDDSKWK
jgi:hypothetical protein